jgi:predicted regulator of Ras-like GTPase activity (Roadblock/LC7/MglB family)
VKTPVQAKFRDVLEALRKKVSEVQAIVIVGPDGVVDHVLSDSSLKIETIANEYAMLLRIAARTSEDAGAGNLVEQIVVSDKSIMVARRVSPQHFLILLARAQDQIGRARFELKQAASEIQRRGIS